jgi:integrase
MARKSSGARLYLDPRRGQWIIRDGARFHRTGCNDRGEAERQFGKYLAAKHEPAPSTGAPLIDDVLAAYREHVPHTARGGREIGFQIENLLRYWSGKRVSEVTARACRGYKNGGGRRDLETLRAAIRYWHREHGPLSSVPVVVLPPKGPPRERWLTRSEAARLVWASRRFEHLKRFILLGLHTGSRAGVLFALRWDWIDLERGVMRRRDVGEREIANKRRPPVKLGGKVLHFLRRWHKQDGGMGHVVHVDGRGVGHVRRTWSSAIVAAGLGRDIVPHTLRHTRATWLVQRGVPLWEVSGHLGMTVAVLESVYGHHSPDHQRRAAEI